MRLSQALAHQVSTRSRTLGYSYFVSGKVQRVKRSDGIVSAIVRGSGLYDVSLEPVGNLLQVSCTCPYFVDHGETCKHVWAALLAAEAQGIPLLEPGSAPATVYLDPVEAIDEDFEDEGDDTRPQPRTMAANRPPTSSPPPWRQTLDAIAAAGAVPASPARAPLASGQLFYVIDVPASMSKSGCSNCSSTNANSPTPF